ncbi:phenylacetate-CoA ligase subunit [Geobacillus sp. GHH01]|uniref:AMP-binding protein n=1 Tax=Geobacillus zalihae TaxID=213419 RepID=A0A7H1RWU6_9BACL|nr:MULTISPECIES: AMP-binding protein [Geobacillus]AGE22027.1 phenylacetate-CoA ligase subunit [Geobacillus sp. GHH01]OQP22104.1 phenylacetate--CoA ligase [Geobacillus zalihae]QNU18735.1 AMP-binding protein [Geobacillus zalihae]
MELSVREMELSLKQYQLHKINELLVFVTQFNEFYKEKFRDICLPIQTMDDFRKLPFTTKEELVQDQQLYPPFGRNHCYPETSYVRYHQTSGTSGKPLKILDTEESWNWWRDCWVEVLKSSGVTNRDRLFLAFSFGPFIGFWSAYEAAKKMGTLVIPGGGQSSKERLYSMIENRATVLLCTPSYALHLSEVAEEMGIDLPSTPIRAIITAGEPGGSVPSTREQIETRWGAAVYDHAGMTEMGAYGYSCSARNGLHINEAQFLAEIIDPETLQPVKEGERGELVLTNFSRYGYPLIRYRTRDIVLCSSAPCSCGNSYRFLPGGIIGRADDMVVVRGVNIFPSSIETIVREFMEIKEFRIVYYTEHEMNQVKVQIESEEDVGRRLADRLRERIGIRIDVERVPSGSLPRFSMKAKRVIDERNRPQQVS